MEQRIPPPQSRRISEDDYLRMEEASRDRHEFRNGEIIAMAGGTDAHSGIAANLIVEIGTRLKGTPCSARTSDLRVCVSETGEYLYPDVIVACEPLEFYRPPSRTSLLNPRLLVEVTSESSEADDRGDKFSQYRLVPSLQEYVLVSSLKPQVETFYKQPDGVWAIGATVSKMDGVLRLRSLQMEIPLTEVYAKIQLPTAANKPKQAES